MAKDLAEQITELELENFRLRTILANFIQGYQPSGRNMQLDVAHARAKLYFEERNKQDGTSTSLVT